MKHLLFDLIDCPSDLLDNEQHIRQSLYQSVTESKSKLIHLQVHKFEPQGVTGYALLAESHISIHTWPEKGIAKCDIFTCSDDCEPHNAVEYLSKQLQAQSTTIQQHERV
tara:strand:+ start:116 stop:445 length:330 start_codon:yes stop_codon:yes gene_type:complete